MIWEVDEDCDQALTWPEFQAMYQRCRNDQTGAHEHVCAAVLGIVAPARQVRKSGAVPAADGICVVAVLSSEQVRSTASMLCFAMESSCIFLGQSLASAYWSTEHKHCRASALGARAGYEPRRLFNVVQFVMNAHNGRATVTLEDAMQIMYLRYGRQMLDSQARHHHNSFAACRMCCLGQYWPPHNASTPKHRLIVIKMPMQIHCMRCRAFLPVV